MSTKPSSDEGPIHVESYSTVMAEPDDFLTAELVRAWVAKIPSGATIEAVVVDRGTQRDPVPVTKGLKASWSEVRR